MKPRAFGISQIQNPPVIPHYIEFDSTRLIQWLFRLYLVLWHVNSKSHIRHQNFLYSGARIFLRHLNFVDRRFLYFAGTNFCDFERLFFFSKWVSNFAIFRKSRLISVKYNIFGVLNSVISHSITITSCPSFAPVWPMVPSDDTFLEIFCRYTFSVPGAMSSDVLFSKILFLISSFCFGAE